MKGATTARAGKNSIFRHRPGMLPVFRLCIRLLAGTALLASLGCATTYDVTVRAIARHAVGRPEATSFVIRDANGSSLGELRRREIATAVRTALSAHGLHEAGEAKAADLVVEIAYGIEPPSIKETVTQEIAFGRPVIVGDRLGAAPEGVTRELMGYTEVVSTEIVREKYVTICGRRNATDDTILPASDLWRVDVTIANESQDLRGHLPILISAAMDFIAKSTDGEITIGMRSDDEAVQFVQRGM